MSRIKKLRKEAWTEKQHRVETERLRQRREAERAGKRDLFKKAKDDLTRAEKETIAREELLEALEKKFTTTDPGPVFDCVVWFDEEHYNVLIDTDEDGDLTDEKILRPFGVAGEYADFGTEEASLFAVQVYEKGKLLSIVTVSSSHGSHVASIAAAHFPGQPQRNGIAPGAQILSIRIGDVRLGGSSDLTGEMRAVALCARYKADIMNASWGGSSSYQDGSDLSCAIYNMLSEKYGVTAFVSAGNNGPALSTLGNPGGEAASIIGVGAYVSDDMGKYLYNVTRNNPNTSYHFTSRGPAKNGDLGVDVMGPGGAVASLAYDNLRQSQLYNGTSMSSPSLAGLGALLVSGAKQKSFDHSPARIRAALMNGAKFLDDVDVWAQGAGLAQALPAWDHLEKNQDQLAWNYFYHVFTPNNTYTHGPGLYLREPVAAGEREVRFEISPRFPASIENKEKFLVEEDLVLKATEPWVNLPEYARLANGKIYLKPILDIPEKKHVSEGPLYAEIHAMLASRPEAGPLFRIPLTIVRPEQTETDRNHRQTLDLAMSPGATARR
ncbi:MAG: S8 family serine peptidase, partial [Verrucomicrobiota bacterium]